MPLHFGGRMTPAGQLPSLQSYTQFLVFYKDKHDVLGLEVEEYRTQVVGSLKAASRKLLARFPWLGWKIGCSGEGERYVFLSVI